MAKAIAEATSTTADKLLETARTFFASLLPSVTLDDQGKPQVSFGVKWAVDADVHLDEVLQAPARIAAREERKLVIVFDEFQQILEYETDHVERSLRSAVQMQGGIACVFSGSRKHLIQRMFLDKSRPLYRAGGHYPRSRQWIICDYGSVFQALDTENEGWRRGCMKITHRALRVMRNFK